MKVLIVSANALGDTYLSSSAVASLRKIVPDAAIDLITLKECSVFTEYLGYNDVFFIEKRGAGELLRARKFLNGKKYNFVFSFFPGRMNSLLVMQSASENKFYYKNLLKIKDWFGTSQHIYCNSVKTDAVWEPGMNYMQRVKLILDAAFGADVDVEKPLFGFIPFKTNSPEREIVINFSSRDESRAISKNLIYELSEYAYKVFGRRTCVLDFYGEFHETLSPVVFPEDYDFRKIIGRIVDSDLFVSVDSFLIHPAEAYGVNLLGVFGPTNPGSVLTRGGKNFIKINPLRHLRIEDIVPSVRKMLGEE